MEHEATHPPIEMLGVDVASSYAPNPVLVQGVNWRLQAGEYWVVGGLSGSGKSHLLTTAAGVMRPARGTYRIFGEEPSTVAEEESIRLRLRVGMVFASEGRLFRHLTVAENVALPLDYHAVRLAGDIAERVGEVLEATGLRELANRFPGSINREMRRRVALARALAVRPAVLLLDEPLRGLDPREARWWLDFLAQLSQGHPLNNSAPMTLAVTSGDYHPWLDRAGKFALIDEGRWLLLGSADELRQRTELAVQEMLNNDFTRG